MAIGRWSFAFAVVALLIALHARAGTVDIETVRIGNLGNSADSTGWGAVDYVYYMGKYMVTAGQYRDFLNAVDPDGLDSDDLYSSDMEDCGITLDAGAAAGEKYGLANAGWEKRPVSQNTWYNAAMMANWMTSGDVSIGAYDTSAGAGWGDPDATNYTGITARDSAAMDALVDTYGEVWVIPTEDEWYKAAYYDPTLDSGNGGYWTYPTQSNDAPGYVNNDGDLIDSDGVNQGPFSDGVTDPGNFATWDVDADPDGIGSPYYTTEVGEWENSASYYGTFDQGGNPWESTERLSSSDGRRGLRGGPFISANIAKTVAHKFGPTGRDWSVGFRLAMIPEPSGLVLLLSGLIIGFARRGRPDGRPERG